MNWFGWLGREDGTISVVNTELLDRETVDNIILQVGTRFPGQKDFIECLYKVRFDSENQNHWHVFHF